MRFRCIRYPKIYFRAATAILSKPHGVVTPMLKGRSMYQFNKCEDRGNRLANEHLWYNIYEQVFGRIVWWEKLSGHAAGQKLGHDRILWIEGDDKSILYRVEEKVAMADVNHFHLEIHDQVDYRGNGAKMGWFWKGRYTCDYISFLSLSESWWKAYIFDWPFLQKIVKDNFSVWNDKGYYKVQPNQAYWSATLAVPHSVLLKAAYPDTDITDLMAVNQAQLISPDYLDISTFSERKVLPVVKEPRNNFN